jgi:formylmethanofuran dehydrogenase subunit A
MRLKISGGRLYDPSSGLTGEVGDLFIAEGRLVAPLKRVDQVMEAAGRVVVAAGLDLRGQVATYGLNFRRAGGGLPAPRELAASYAALGYTHVHEPFLTLATANYVHCQLAALPLLDTSASLVVNLRDLDLWLKSPEQRAEVGESLQFLLERTGALNFRVVEPYVRYRQEFYAHRVLGVEEALTILAELARNLKLPLSLEASPEVLTAGLPQADLFHLAALGPALVADELSAAAADWLAQGATGDMGLLAVREEPPPGAPGLAVDLGWFRPLNLAPAAGAALARRALALALNYEGDRLAFSGAGASLAPVKDYPRLFAWLADRSCRRRDWGAELSPEEYSLSRWVWATRTLPARLLGLLDRGHLRPGARADVAIYEPAATGALESWRCRTLLKAGELVVDDYQLVNPEAAKATYYRQTGAEETGVVRELCQYQSLRPENLWVPPELQANWQRV